MSETVRFTVHGTPAPQGSKTAFARNGKRWMTDGGPSGKSRSNFTGWRQAVATAARDWQDENRRPLLDEPVAMRVVFVLPKPKSAAKWRWLPWVKPDIDKLARAVMDSCKGLIWRDDALVVDLRVVKVYDVARPPGCDVEVIPLGEVERSSSPEGWVAMRAMAEAES